MSTVSGVGSSATAYATQALQQPQRQRPSGPPPEFQQQFTSIAESFGLDSTEASSLMSDIDSVMQDAFQSGASREDVESSIASVLEEHGIDAEEFKAKMDAAFKASGQRPPSGPPPFPTSDDADSTDASEADTSSIALDIAKALKNLPAGSVLDVAA